MNESFSLLLLGEGLGMRVQSLGTSAVNSFDVFTSDKITTTRICTQALIATLSQRERESEGD
jgi:hypothetical protein